jgi:cobalt-zinc-cadmium efflux system outer membrane protein
MHIPNLAALLAGIVAVGCHTYAPEPVDLDAHARLFAERMPDAESVRRFVAGLRQADPTLSDFDLGDGLSLQEARYVALIFNSELRTARLRAGVARASAAEAGRWADPELHGDFQKILESVSHPWVSEISLGLTLPITGRPGLEKELADSRHGQALVEARLAEAQVLNQLDSVWTRWSNQRLGVVLLEDLVRRLLEIESIASRLARSQLLTNAEARAFTLERITREAQLLRAKGAVAAAEIVLKQLLGLPPERAVTFVPALAVPLCIADPLERHQHLGDSPRVALARREHEVAERHLALAVRKQYPELTLFPGFHEEDGQPRAALGFSLPLPLWNGNAREIAEATATREVAAEELRGRFERAAQDLARAEVARTAVQQQRQLVETQLIPLAQQQIEDARALAELGQLNTLLILDALTRSYEAKALAIDSALAEAEATVELNTLFWPTLTVGAAGDAAR